MVIELVSVLPALEDAGIAVGSVGGAVLLVLVSAKGFHWIRDAIGDTGSTDWLYRDQREGETYEQWSSRHGVK